MGSVIVTWKGQCLQQDIQNELLAFLRPLAMRQQQRWAALPPPRPAFVDKLAAHRAEGMPLHPTVRFFDQELEGRILVRSDVDTDPRQLIEAAAQLGLSYEPEEPRGRHVLLHLERLHVRGLDVRLYDPRALYPGEDRLSFVFLQSEAAPYLDGRLALLTEQALCARSPDRLIRTADWYVECPYLHLRYYLEGWIDRLLAWVKFFFIPDLSYTRYEPLPGYEALRALLEALQEEHGYPDARALFFEVLLADDDAEWDGRFPDHPLSRCRRHLQMLEKRLSLKEDFTSPPALS